MLVLALIFSQQVGAAPVGAAQVGAAQVGAAQVAPQAAPPAVSPFAPAAAPAPVLAPVVPGAPAAAPADADALIAALDHAEFDARQQAEARLAAELSLDAIADALARPGLSPEQRARLQRAGRTRMATTPRAALGVQYAPSALGVRPWMNESPGGGITIGATVEGFPSERLLRAGDVVRTVHGEPVLFQEQFRAMIISHDPGEVMRLGVVRAGRFLTLDVPTGRFSDLAAPASQINEVNLTDAWEFRLRRRAGAEALAPRADLVENPFSPEGWREARLEQNAAPPDDEQSRAIHPPRLVAGGAPRDGTQRFMEFGGTGLRQPGVRIFNGGGPDAPGAGLAEQRRTLQAIINELGGLQQDRLRTAAEDRRRAADDALSPAERAAALTRAEALEAEARLLGAQVEERRRLLRQIDGR